MCGLPRIMKQNDDFNSFFCDVTFFGMEKALTLPSLPKPALNLIWQCSDVHDVLALSSTCRALRESCFEYDAAWRAFSQRRWGPDALQSQLFSSAGLPNYRALFFQCNGWRRGPPLLIENIHDPEDAVVATSCITATDGNEKIHATTISKCHHIQLVEIAASGEATHSGAYAGPDPNYPACSIECLDRAAGIVAYGDMYGGLHFVKLSIADPRQPAEELETFLPGDRQDYPISWMQHHAQSSRLFCLWDRGECGVWRPFDRGVCRVFDVETFQETAAAQEILDYYELCSMLPVGDSGNELIGGAVKLSQDRWETGACGLCTPNLPASLCHHQHRSSHAALAFFDLRSQAPGRMVERHPLPHRSLYPRMQLAREHYLLLSHAGAPLTVWDRRMLGEGPATAPELDLDSLVLPRPRDWFLKARARQSNSLYLSCHGSAVAGRADNGAIGVWDISRLLGWWADEGKTRYSEVEKTLPPNATASCKPSMTLAVPFPPSADVSGIMRQRAEVWLGADWLAARDRLGLQCFRISR